MSSIIDINKSNDFGTTRHYVDGLFDSVKLNSGDIDQQLHNWRKSDGMSIFIEWVPDQMTEQNAIELFEKYGVVNSVRFVEKTTDKGKKRSAYVKYNNWNFSCEGHLGSDIEDISRAFPGYHMIDFHTIVYKNKQVERTFKLKCRVNRTESNPVIHKQPPTNYKNPNLRPPILQRQTNQIPFTNSPQTIEERLFYLEQQYVNLWREMQLLKSALHYDTVTGNTFIPR